MRQGAVRVGVRGMRALVLGLPVLLGACGLFGEDDEILEGTRVPVRPPEEVVTAVARDLVLPPAVAVTEWTHRNGNAQHLAPHAELSGSLRLLWAADAGTGNAGRAYVTAAPVVAQGRIYTLDAASEVRAFSTEGRLLWAASVAREGEDGRDGHGGGLAFDDGTLFVATGFGEALALDPATGEIRWRVRLDGPVRAAPVALAGRLFVVTRQDLAYALDAKSGDVIWRVQGAAGVTGLLGGASPAADMAVAVFPFASGEIAAVLSVAGRRVWTAAIAGGRRGLARTAIGDITGEPVIDGETIYAANQSGRLVAIERRTGNRLWTANTGSTNPVVPAGGSLFVMSDTGELQRLDAQTGGRIWAVQLPEYEDAEDRTDAIGYGGPVLAGGRLVVVSTAGELLSFDPETGAERGRVTFPGGSYLSPAVAGGRLYVMTLRGELLAFQ